MKAPLAADEPSRDFTESFEEVLLAERQYLNARREANQLPDTDDDAALWGLALSGGGVRSATFGLGLLQALIGRGSMRRFDYLSTVSGGGYIGSCLSSLLSNPHDEEEKRDTGVDALNSPFVGLRKDDGYAQPEQTHLGVRHQIHHLRTHGEYLIPRNRLLSRDVQRAVGSIVPGMGHTILLFLLFFITCIALLHLTLGAMDPDLDVLAQAGPLLGPEAAGLERLAYLKAVVSAWYETRIAPPFAGVFTGAREHWPVLAWFVLGGFLWATGWLVAATVRASKLQQSEQTPKPNTRSGWTREDQSESDFVRAFNISSMAIGTIAVLAVSLYYVRLKASDEFLAALALPFACSLGGLVVAQFLTYSLETVFAQLSWLPRRENAESRFRRSLYGAVRGACVYGTVVAVLLPGLVIVLFSLALLPFKFFISLAGLAWAYALTRKGASPEALQLGGWVKRPVANLAVVVFLSFGFATISARLLEGYRAGGADSLALDAATVAAIAGAAFLALGVLIDANRVSPHYFYRDRLTEAYLKTNARVLRADGASKRQGMPLTVLRDDEDLKLSELGANNTRGPYHLIVTALNLRGSNELNRKSFLSEHFIFSRNYVGSPVTGWVRTNEYREDTTRLARVMTISAAAVGSVMGYHTFGAQAFVTTLFNLRLGYWMENPWFYRPGARRRSTHGLTFWPRYLAKEIFGIPSARSARINLSDGGHTGDNLGLMPLMERRCAVIVVADVEADSGYAFESFNNAVRMAFIERNIRIEIDLSPIMARHETPAGITVSEASVVTGTIHYPDDGSANAFDGQLIYVKSSVSGDRIPVHVAAYAKENAAFPHESTADQFFDDAQFEAYRALGEHLGDLASDHLDAA